MMSICGFMEMNTATCRYMPIEKDDDLPNHNSTSRFPRVGTAGHVILLMSDRDYRWEPLVECEHSQGVAFTWEEAIAELSEIRP